MWTIISLFFINYIQKKYDYCLFTFSSFQSQIPTTTHLLPKYTIVVQFHPTFTRASIRQSLPLTPLYMHTAHQTPPEKQLKHVAQLPAHPVHSVDKDATATGHPPYLLIGSKRVEQSKLSVSDNKESE